MIPKISHLLHFLGTPHSPLLHKIRYGHEKHAGEYPGKENIDFDHNPYLLRWPFCVQFWKCEQLFIVC